MTDRLRARGIRAGALIALAGGMLALSAAPAAAAPPSIRIESVSPERVTSGESVQVRFRVTNNNRLRGGTAVVAVSGGFRCTGGCSATSDLDAGESETFQATVVAPQARAGETTGLNISVTARIGLQTGFDSRMVYVSGEDESSSVRQVSGRVSDADGKAVRGAAVTLRDSAGHEYRTTSDAGGSFAVTSSDSRPIAAGSVTVVATKDGYRSGRATTQAAGGGTATVRLTLTAATVLPSKLPSAVATTPPETADPVEQNSADVALPAAGTPASKESNASVLLTVLGVLLVVAGLGALLLVVLRRRTDPPDSDTLIHPDDLGPGPPPPPGAAAPPAGFTPAGAPPTLPSPAGHRHPGAAAGPPAGFASAGVPPASSSPSVYHQPGAGAASPAGFASAGVPPASSSPSAYHQPAAVTPSPTGFNQPGVAAPPPPGGVDQPAAAMPAGHHPAGVPGSPRRAGHRQAGALSSPAPGIGPDPTGFPPAPEQELSYSPAGIPVAPSPRAPHNPAFAPAAPARGTAHHPAVPATRHEQGGAAR